MSDLDRVLQKFDAVEARLVQILDPVETICNLLCEIVDQCNNPQGLNPKISAIYGRRCQMAEVIAVPQLLDTEKILLSVMPRKADGHVDTAAVVSWTSSDSSQVGIEEGVDPFIFHDPQFDEEVECPGKFNCYALTPLTSGSASVTASAPGYDSAEFGPINYAAGQARSLNASVGSPLSDL